MFNQLTSALPDGFFGSGNKRRHQQTTAGEEENQPHHYLHAGEAKLQMPPTKTMHVSNGKSTTGRVALRNITNNTTAAPLPAAAPLSQSSRPKAKITKSTSTDRRKKRSSLSSRRRTKKSVTSTPNAVADEEEEEEENPLVALRGSDSQSSMDVILPSPISATTSTKHFSHSEALLVSAAESSARTRASHDQMELEQRAMDSDYEVDRDTACEATSSSNAASPNEAKQKEEVVVARKQAVDEEEQTIGGGWEVLDIDFVDEQDPQWCTSYVNDIYVNLRINEQLRRPRRLDYMTSVQKGITASMRGILCDWLVEVADEYELSSETLFLAVNYLDRFLAERRIDKRKFQLVGVTAMFIAAKYEEIYAPAVEEFVYISANTYSREEILMMEAHILNTLEFQLTAATTKVFLRRFLKAAGADLTVAFLASYLAELTLLEYSFVKYLPSQIAAAAVFLALRTLNREPWTPTLTFYTQYSINDAELQQCIQELYNMYCAMNENASLQAVREKYSHKRFHRVSTIPPPEVSTGQ
ncbi:Cyclin-A2 [Balamuthia mandrillaris]